eukprot:augustus_masked-scaffold_15-processed-gene-9.51-mRNA-1 protein AED:0.86 eAED:0.86 QI:0/-1/0/1/-1/1/1/0/445
MSETFLERYNEKLSETTDRVIRLFSAIEQKINELITTIDKIKSGSEEKIPNFAEEWRGLGQIVDNSNLARKELTSLIINEINTMQKQFQEKYSWTEISNPDKHSETYLKIILEYLELKCTEETFSSILLEVKSKYPHMNLSVPLTDTNINKEKIKQLETILNSLKEKNLDSLINWFESNEDKLKGKKSVELGFLLQKVEFLRLVNDNKILEAVEFAREKFSSLDNGKTKEFTKEMTEEIHVLASKFLIGKPENSEKIEVEIEQCFHQLESLFTNVFSSLHGISSQNPLEALIEVGNEALPKLAKAFSFRTNKFNPDYLNLDSESQQEEEPSDENQSGDETTPIENGHEPGINQSEPGDWTQLKELPIDSTSLLGKKAKERKFHSVICCPITKEAVTKENPAVLLQCGHVVAKNSLNKMRKTSNGEVKCPTCPNEQDPKEILVLHF